MPPPPPLLRAVSLHQETVDGEPVGSATTGSAFSSAAAEADWETQSSGTGRDAGKSVSWVQGVGCLPRGFGQKGEHDATGYLRENVWVKSLISLGVKKLASGPAGGASKAEEVE